MNRKEECMSKMESIKAVDLARMEKTYRANEKARIIRNALTCNDISKIAVVQESKAANPNLFSVDIKTMKATNQLRSGRCWIFSAMNVLREIIARKYKIEEFELSQNYIAFYDKLEKANWFMECIMQELDSPIGSETNRWLLENGIGDGGQWDMLVSLVKKYGICPKTAYPESYQAGSTGRMNQLLNQRLKRFALDARKLHAEGNDKQIKAVRSKALSECYGLICDCFGVPPKSFTFEYYDSRKKYHAVNDVTPAEFYEKYLAEDLDNYVVIINAPTDDKPYYKTYTVKYIGNVVAGNPVRYLNLPMNEFKNAVIAQMKDGSPVWFGCDCSKDGDRETGLWDDMQFDFENTFDMKLDMTKAEMLDARFSAMNHAMVLTGVNLSGRKPARWKIENSWGDKSGIQGYYICSDTWFDRYVFEAAVNKKYLTAEQQKMLRQEPAVLDPWDPFGTLAD